ncbi:MAG: YggS family pyridoxal phosphate-dependent enzyme, partial [Rhodothermales bacterium]
VGHLQRNKAKDVVACADVFHALESLRLAAELDRRAAQAGRRLPCFVQVNVSGEASKFGLGPDDILEMLEGLLAYEHLQIVGLMTLAAPVADPEAVRPQFRRLRQVFEQGYAAEPMHSLSMGMSGDFEVAIEEGATHVRLGTALFGPRPR